MYVVPGACNDLSSFLARWSALIAKVSSELFSLASRGKLFFPLVADRATSYRIYYVLLLADDAGHKSCAFEVNVA